MAGESEATMNIYLRRGRAALITFACEGSLIAALLYLLAHLEIPGRVSFGVPLAAAAGFTSLVALLLMLTRELRRVPGFRFRHETLLTAALIAGIAISGALLARWHFSRQGDLYAAILFQSAVLIPALILSWRWFARRARVTGFCREKVAILGTGELARQVSSYIDEYIAADFRVVGFIGETADDSCQQLGPHPRLATLDALERLSPTRVERVIVALEERRGMLPADTLIDLRLRGVKFEEVAPFVERTSGKIHVDGLLPSLILFSDGFRVSPLRMITKRVFDFLASGALLTVTWPVMLLAAVAIRLDSKGPVFYRQERVGKHGKVFQIFKFRSMVNDAEKLSGPQWASQSDVRVTQVGRFIRKCRIDELPQIINIFKGDMSFVGPRPERPVFVTELEPQIPYYKFRSAVRPGLTGWAQVCYAYGASVDDAKQKLKYASPILDLWIVLKTIRVVLFGAGAR